MLGELGELALVSSTGSAGCTGWVIPGRQAATWASSKKMEKQDDASHSHKREACCDHLEAQSPGPRTFTPERRRDRVRLQLGYNLKMCRPDMCRWDSSWLLVNSFHLQKQGPHPGGENHEALCFSQVSFSPKSHSKFLPFEMIEALSFHLPSYSPLLSRINPRAYLCGDQPLRLLFCTDEPRI